MDTEKRKRQTFVVEVMEQQRYTWQGRIHWVEENKKEYFRSILEMLHLMDSAVSPKRRQQETGETEKNRNLSGIFGEFSGGKKKRTVAEK